MSCKLVALAATASLGITLVGCSGTQNPTPKHSVPATQSAPDSHTVPRTATPTASTAPSDNSCMNRPASDVVRLTGGLTGTQGSAELQAKKTWDIRGFRQTTNPRPTRYPFRLDQANGVCVIGGTVIGNIPRDWPREVWYHGTDTTVNWDGEGYRITQTSDSPYTYQYGSYVENVSDGYDPNAQVGSIDYLDHVHAKYVRDDCIENEEVPHSMTITDSLFDGCFTFIGMRPTGMTDNIVGTTPGTLEIRNSLIYVQPQPLSTNDCSKYPDRCVNGLGNHTFFKWSSAAVKNVVVRNSVLRMDQPSRDGDSGMKFPAGTYQNVTLVWTWPKPYTDYAPLPPGVTVTNDVEVWNRARDQWLAENRSVP
ncbi:MAG TPA: hypothetical protein VFX41_03875 [Actinomycetales bacterium]|nr:hypothetical protein [Actinomycetales bacterium]